MEFRFKLFPLYRAHRLITSTYNGRSKGFKCIPWSRFIWLACSFFLQRLTKWLAACPLWGWHPTAKNSGHAPANLILVWRLCPRVPLWVRRFPSPSSRSPPSYWPAGYPSPACPSPAFLSYTPTPISAKTGWIKSVWFVQCVWCTKFLWHKMVKYKLLVLINLNWNLFMNWILCNSIVVFTTYWKVYTGRERLIRTRLIRSST